MTTPLRDLALDALTLFDGRIAEDNRRFVEERQWRADFIAIYRSLP